MIKVTAAVNGMACGMCEAHINDAVRKAFPKAKKVSSSKGKKQTSFIIDEPVDTEEVKAVINRTGYECVSVETSEYVKKGLFW